MPNDEVVDKVNERLVIGVHVINIKINLDNVSRFFFYVLNLIKCFNYGIIIYVVQKGDFGNE